MSRVVAFLGRALQALGIVCVTLIVASVPPLCNVAGSWVRAVNPVAGLLHVQNTLNGAHGALIATAGIELGVFDALALVPPPPPPRAAMDDPPAAPPSWWAQLLPSALPLGFSEGFTMGFREALFNVTSAYHSAETIAAVTGLRVDDTVDLLDALASLGLVEVGHTPTEDSEEDGGAVAATYRTTIASALFIAGPASLGRMARVSNHPHVLQQLRDLPATLRRRAMTQGRRDADDRLFFGDTGDLWDIYAAESGGFNRDLAKRAAEHIGFSDSTAAVAAAAAATVVVDIGAGSGEYTDAVVQRAPAAQSPLGILVDLPGPLDSLGAASNRHTRVRGSFFDNATVDAACAAAATALSSRATTSRSFDVVLMLNSFAQHFPLAIVQASVGKLACCIVQRLRGEEQVAAASQLRLRLAVTELVRPDGPFSAWREPVPVGRQFHLVLRSLAPHGEVRRASAYERFLHRAMADIARNVTPGGPDAAFDAEVVTSTLFPMPANVFTSTIEIAV